jgi:hypothetical protein
MCEVAETMCAGIAKTRKNTGTTTVPPPIPKKLERNPVARPATIASGVLVAYR